MAIERIERVEVSVADRMRRNVEEWGELVSEGSPEGRIMEVEVRGTRRSILTGAMGSGWDGSVVEIEIPGSIKVYKDLY